MDIDSIIECSDFQEDPNWKNNPNKKYGKKK